ncbi:VPLPA-CTERM sorting domain-containing protein [Palleronia sp. KMU-117]|uniref:VPLPA-CTERM sorting domain-containing protein n=1 Tax=Palleronia sp. KMU-117 TaxID=3434108 RepID=UPI003D7297C1
MKFDLRHAALASFMLAGSATIASAATIYTHDFDDPPPAVTNGDTVYKKDGYTYSPLNFNSSDACYTIGDAPGDTKRCFLEVRNGEATNVVQDDKDPFDLLSFHFNFQGDNSNAGGPNAQPAINRLDLFSMIGEAVGPTTNISLGSAYDGTGAFKIYLASDTSAVFTGALVKQTGYFVVFNDWFDGITKFTWDAVDNKQIRIDCVSISPDGANISASDLGECAPSSTPVIPLPAAGWLLIAGIGGLAAVKKRKRAA